MMTLSLNQTTNQDHFNLENRDKYIPSHPPSVQSNHMLILLPFQNEPTSRVNAKSKCYLERVLTYVTYITKIYFKGVSNKTIFV